MKGIVGYPNMHSMEVNHAVMALAMVRLRHLQFDVKGFNNGVIARLSQIGFVDAGTLYQECEASG